MERDRASERMNANETAAYQVLHLAPHLMIMMISIAPPSVPGRQYCVYRHLVDGETEAYRGHEIIQVYPVVSPSYLFDSTAALLKRSCVYHHLGALVSCRFLISAGRDSGPRLELRCCR